MFVGKVLIIFFSIFLISVISIVGATEQIPMGNGISKIIPPLNNGYTVSVPVAQDLAIQKNDAKVNSTNISAVYPIDSFSPRYGFTDEKDVLFTVKPRGGIYLGKTIALKRNGYSDIQGTKISSSPIRGITCRFNLSGAAPGKWSLYVVFHNFEPLELPDVFTVYDHHLSVSDVAPRYGVNNRDCNVTLNGTGFTDITGVNLTSGTYTVLAKKYQYGKSG